MAIYNAYIWLCMPVYGYIYIYIIHTQTIVFGVSGLVLCMPRLVFGMSGLVFECLDLNLGCQHTTSWSMFPPQVFFPAKKHAPS